MQKRILHQDDAGWKWQHSYVRLPQLFFERCNPQPVAAPKPLVFNRDLATRLGLDSIRLAGENAAELFSGNRLPSGVDPIAQAYAGHQFGHFTGLGDGRAILLGEHIAPDGTRWDIQLKGSGRTRFSRGGDGRAALGPMLREYLISEAMAALGIPTTRSLAVVLTGEEVFRNKSLPGAVLVRVAASHIRVGTFQWAAAHEDIEASKALLEHTARRHFPKIDPADARAFFLAVMEKQIALVVEWMRVGFVHGVMNTDNVALSGETIDYGPCAFMDAYDPDTVFSSIDRGGRYAYTNQPSITRWNLARLAEALLPLIDEKRASAVDFANESLSKFEENFHNRWLAMMRAKIGLLTEQDGDPVLIKKLLDHMHEAGMDFTNTFSALSREASSKIPPAGLGSLSEWHGLWKERLARQPQSAEKSTEVMKRNNPSVIPRNHLVESALEAAETGDLTSFQELLDTLISPYSETQNGKFTQPPPVGTPRYVTYCGT